MEQTEVVFVHGALVRDGAWWWHPTAELLNDRTGVQSRSVALLSCGETADPPSDGVYADADALRVMREEVDEAIVVAHSYGGTVVAELGDHQAVRALMYISSYLPEEGESQSGIVGGETDPVRIRPWAEGVVGLDGHGERAFAERFRMMPPSSSGTVREVGSRRSRLTPSRRR